MEENCIISQQPNVCTKEIHRVLSSGRNMQPEMQLLLHHPEKKMERKAA